eukprot:5792378-Pyramimonas_sp.AAC.1
MGAVVGPMLETLAAVALAGLPPAGAGCRCRRRRTAGVGCPHLEIPIVQRRRTPKRRLHRCCHRVAPISWAAQGPAPTASGSG